MSKVYTVSRFLLGIIFVVFGSNGLMMVLTGSGFIPMPTDIPADVMEKMGAFFKLGYLMPLVKSLQVISGLLLLSNRYVNLAIIFLGPIVLNILLVHIFIDLSGLPMAVIISILLGLVIKSRWNDLKVILKA
ncbi:MAG TPA: hypothetical protein PKC21_06450 [Oligoflexia bacterium]|nr:hypothetical protein [Oligoflexia bacterium]HMR24975.1 hypothetical protein [Oligoflexia bacterium]